MFMLFISVSAFWLVFWLVLKSNGIHEVAVPLGREYSKIERNFFFVVFGIGMCRILLEIWLKWSPCLMLSLTESTRAGSQAGCRIG